MSPRPHHRLNAVLAVGCLTVLAACGGSDGDSADESADAGSGSDGELVIDAAVAEPVGGDDAAAADEVLVVDEAATDTATEATGETESEPTEQTDEEQALAFAECMRAEGLDWPDPTTNADGSVDPLGGRLLRDVAGTDPEATQAAADVCSPLLDGASFLPGGDGGFDAETQDTFVEFAACLRDQGLDVDDPDFSDGAGPGALGSLFGPDFDPNDPVNSAAIDECSVLFAGGPLAGAGGQG